MEVNRGTLSHSSLNHNEPYSYSNTVKTTRYYQTTAFLKESVKSVVFLSERVSFKRLRDRDSFTEMGCDNMFMFRDVVLSPTNEEKTGRILVKVFD